LPRGLDWQGRHPAGAIAYVSFSTVAAPLPDELREIAYRLEESGAPFLWSLREDAWPLLPPGFLDSAMCATTNSGRLLVPWAP
jgi:anthocyanidin 3-O-glucosyltransferase